MRPRRFVIISASALAALGGGAAIAATDGDKGKKAENAILSDAAERLDVSSDDLRSALSEAREAQIDQAVEDGDLTQDQADRIKQHIEDSGHVLGLGPGGPGRPGMHHGPGGPPFFDAIADELGISVEKLHEQLRGGKSLKQVAKANGKTMADVKAAAKAAIEERIAEDLEAGQITESQADEMREHLPDLLDHLGERPRFGPGGPHHRGPGGPPMGPPSDAR